MSALPKPVLMSKVHRCKYTPVWHLYKQHAETCTDNVFVFHGFNACKWSSLSSALKSDAYVTVSKDIYYETFFILLRWILTYMCCIKLANISEANLIFSWEYSCFFFIFSDPANHLFFYDIVFNRKKTQTNVSTDFLQKN